jgi:hypothetical protein
MGSTSLLTPQASHFATVQRGQEALARLQNQLAFFNTASRTAQFPSGGEVVFEACVASTGVMVRAAEMRYGLTQRIAIGSEASWPYMRKP